MVQSDLVLVEIYTIWARARNLRVCSVFTSHCLTHSADIRTEGGRKRKIGKKTVYDCRLGSSHIDEYGFRQPLVLAIIDIIYT